MRDKSSEMKRFARRIENSVPGQIFFFSWIKLITLTGGVQLIVQLVGLVSGIIIIRLLSTNEYGLYTLANTMLGTMTILADGGIGAGVMAQGGKVWQDRQKLGAVLSTGLELRRKFAIGSLIISTPVLFYLLLHNGANWTMAVLIVASLIPAFYAALSDSLLEIVPKLHQAILPLQKNQLIVGIGRLLLSAITLFAFPWTFVAILAGSFPRIYGNIKLKKITYELVDKEQPSTSEVKQEILKGVKRLLPLSVYYTVSGQVTIWLLSVFGSAISIGQIGALGRFSMLLTLFSVVFSNLLIPRFARLKMNRKNIISKFVQINLLLLLSIAIILLSVWIFQNQLLWILGDQYTGLNSAFILVMLTGCVNLMVGSNFSLLTSRGWIMNPLSGIPIGICSIIIGAFLIDVSTLTGAIYYNLFLASYSLIVAFLFFVYKIRLVKEIS